MAMSTAAAAPAAAYLWMCAHEYPQTWQLREGAENTVRLSARHRTNQEPTQWSIVTMLWYH